MSDQPSTPPPPPPPSADQAPSDEATTRKPWWKRWWGVTLIVVLLFVFIGSVGADEDDGPATNDAGGEAEPEPTPDDPGADEAESEEAGDDEARIGDTIVLAGRDEALIATTLVEMLDPATPERREPDGRYVAFEVQYENVGDVVYQDSPNNQWEIVDTDNRQHSTTVRNVEDCPRFGGSVRLAVDDVRVGCVVFDIPEDVEVQYVNAALNSGRANQTGRWLP